MDAREQRQETVRFSHYLRSRAPRRPVAKHDRRLDSIGGGVAVGGAVAMVAVAMVAVAMVVIAMIVIVVIW